MDRRVPLESWLLRTLLVQVLVTTSIHMMRPMVSYRALELGAGAVDLGIVAASFAALPFVLAVPMGRWVDRLSEPPFLAGGALVVLLMAVWLLSINTVAALVLAQAIMGVGQLAHNVGLQTFLANSGAPEARDGRIALYSVVQSIGQMVGPLSAGVIAGSLASTLMPVFMAAGTAAALASMTAVTLIFWPPAQRQAPPSGGPARTSAFGAVGQVIRTPTVPLAMFASMLVIGSIDALIVYLPAYGETNGIPIATIGLLLAARSAAGLASRVMVVALIRWFGRFRLLVASILLPGFAILGLASRPHPVLLFLLMIATGFGLGLGQPLSLVWVANRVPADMRGLAFGMRVSANRGSQVGIPALLGAVGGLTSMAGLFLAQGALLIVGGLGVMRAGIDDESGDEVASPAASDAPN